MSLLKRCINPHRCTSPEPFYRRPHHPRTAALRTEQEDVDRVRPPSAKAVWGGSSRKALQPGALAPATLRAVDSGVADGADGQQPPAGSWQRHLTEPINNEAGVYHTRNLISLNIYSIISI